MNTWIRRTLQVGLVSAGFVLVAGAAAQAGVYSVDNDGILNGTQVVAPVQLPTNVCGNAIALLGDATAGCEGGATARHTTSGGGIVSEDNDGIANGTQIVAPIQAPVNVSGNAAGVLSHVEAGCVGGATARYTTGVAGSGAPGTGLFSGDNDGIANGTQVLAPVQLPVNICGNAVGALFSEATAGCETGALAKFGPHTPTAAELKKAKNLMTTGPGGNPGTPGTPGGGVISEDNDGILNGTQVIAPIQAPVNVCGNAVALIGSATAGCEGGATARNTFGGSIISGDNDGILNGTQLVAPIQAPINISGNAVGALLGNAVAGSSGGSNAQL